MTTTWYSPEDRAREVAEWLDYRGLPPTASLKELIEHERENAALAAGFDFVKEHRADVQRVLSLIGQYVGQRMIANVGARAKPNEAQQRQMDEDRAAAEATFRQIVLALDPKYYDRPAAPVEEQA
jgi:hypothetical protein